MKDNSLMNYKNKLAAMFGLDARIALAIFGALSVITGAALYSAIQQANVVSTITEMQELGKAYEQYMLDTGLDLPQNTNHQTYLKVQNLIEKPSPAITGWNGPYTTYQINMSQAVLVRDTVFKHNKYTQALISKSATTDWGDNTGTQVCTATSCAVFVRFDGIPVDVANAIDKYVDGSTSLKTGKVRVYKFSASKYNVWLEIGLPLSNSY